MKYETDFVNLVKNGREFELKHDNKTGTVNEIKNGEKKNQYLISLLTF